MAAWYCLIGEKEYGPFSSERIQSLVEKGKLTRDHFVRSSTDSQWTAASELPGLFPAEKTKDPVPPKAVPAKAVPAKAVPAKAVPAKAVPAKVKPPESPPPAKAKPPVASAAKKPPMAVALPPATEEPEIPSALPVAAPVATPVAAPASLPVGTPVAPAAAAVPSSEPSETIPRGRRKSKQQQYLIAGGLAAVLIVLGGVAIAVLGRSPGEEPGDDEVASSNDPQAKTDVPAPEDVEADPDAETDPDIKAPAGKTPSIKKAAALPSIRKWHDARNPGTLRSAMVRFHVVNAWLNPSQPGSRTLTVEMTVTNLSSKEPLDYRSWSAAGQSAVDTAVFLVDDKGKRLTASSSPRRPEGAVPTSRRLKSQESVTELLVFEAPAAEYEFLRLRLPYAAIGRPGHMGFEIPRVMVKDRPPDSEEPVAEMPAPVVTKPAPDPTVAKPAVVDQMPPSGEQFTIDQLQESIKESLSDGEETKPKPSAPPSKTSGQPKPFDGPRLKVERDDRMEEGPKKE